MTGLMRMKHLPAVALRDLPIFRLALALDAYAYYGLKLPLAESDDIHTIDLFLEDLREAKAPQIPAL